MTEATRPTPAPAKTQTYTCQGCAAQVTRPIVRGQRPKWCPTCRLNGGPRQYAITCAHCGQPSTGHGAKYCSMTCTNRAKPPRPRKPKPAPKPPLDLRSAIRRAYEDGTGQDVIAAIKAECTSTESCWLWTRKSDRSGYPIVRMGKQDVAVHRLVLEAALGAPLGSQHAHHICATPLCVNPEHLQPITHRDNIAEMLARQSYLARIRDLEAALTALAPDHPLLAVIPIA